MAEIFAARRLKHPGDSSHAYGCTRNVHSKNRMRQPCCREAKRCCPDPYGRAASGLSKRLRRKGRSEESLPGTGHMGAADVARQGLRVTTAELPAATMPRPFCGQGESFHAPARIGYIFLRLLNSLFFLVPHNLMRYRALAARALFVVGPDSCVRALRVGLLCRGAVRELCLALSAMRLTSEIVPCADVRAGRRSLTIGYGP